ncbi:dienelactone hydrolase family protein [Asanoa sp. WMMD1127]|uniref:dienelactone hydrolase family protein n=1 Tax=Asanoa sp. WMMD1127 TaxID=3016107 RepID=UPI0024180796|nr:dienelactone hydrolase family protein [Asanoa sp. WMMD1127]MDG4821010.1 dienelactone hydrolase family protein [Asanoa sp. WMMD1127]
MGTKISYPSHGTTAEGYLALPAGADAGTPGVIVLHEWWGLVPHITAIADRFAEAGFVALAPDLYRGESTGDPETARRLASNLPLDRTAADITGAAEFLADRPEVTGEIGAVGFSIGGSFALWAPALSDKVTAGVGFYPSLPWSLLNPDWSRYAGKHAVIHCAEEDGASTADGVRTAADAIQAAGGSVKLYDYPGSRHSFFNDDRPESYDRVDAVTSWARTIETVRRLAPTVV